MPRFSVDKLVVLHLYNYMRPKGEKDPLAQVEKACQVIKLSTCMRTIYVLNKDALQSEEQQKSYQALISYLERKDMYSAATKFDCLEGPTAYQFLLYWILGGVNPKLTFHDSRVLGDVRAIWSKLCVSPSPRAKVLVELYKTLFQDLFIDSTNLSKLIPMYNSLEQKLLEAKLHLACINCAWARMKGYLSYVTVLNYACFAENEHLDAIETILTKVQRNLILRSEVPDGEDALQSSGSQAQRDGIRKRLLVVEQLLGDIKSLKPKPVLAEILAEEKVGSDVVLSSKPIKDALVSSSLIVRPSGFVSFFAHLAEEEFIQVQALSSSLREYS